MHAVGRFKNDPFLQVGENRQCVEIMVTVDATTRDMQRQIDLGRRKTHNRVMAVTALVHRRD